MNKIFTLITAGVLLFAVKQGHAQSAGSSIASQHDTVSFSTAGSYNAVNGIINNTTNNMTVQWKVVASNFPADWLPVTGFCDNNSCYSGSSIWPSGTTYTPVYGAGIGDFHMTIDLTSVATSGTYYMRVRMNNMYVTSDSLYETFIVTKIPTAVPTVKQLSDISLYPNPANNELNVVYDANSDIRTISVYNVIGKLMTVYKVTGNTGANLNLENLSSGVYFVRLMNGHGDVVANRKFTKQ